MYKMLLSFALITFVERPALGHIICPYVRLSMAKRGVHASA